MTTINPPTGHMHIHLTTNKCPQYTHNYVVHTLCPHLQAVNDGLDCYFLNEKYSEKNSLQSRLEPQRDWSIKIFNNIYVEDNPVKDYSYPLQPIREHQSKDNNYDM